MDYQAVANTLQQMIDEAPIDYRDGVDLNDAIWVIKKLIPMQAQIEANKVLAAQPLTEDEEAFLYLYGFWGYRWDHYKELAETAVHIFDVPVEVAKAVLDSLVSKGFFIVEQKQTSWGKPYDQFEPTHVYKLWKATVKPPAKKQTAANNPLVKALRQIADRSHSSDELIALINKGVPEKIILRHISTPSRVKYYGAVIGAKHHDL